MSYAQVTASRAPRAPVRLASGPARALDAGAQSDDEFGLRAAFERSCPLAAELGISLEMAVDDAGLLDASAGQLDVVIEFHKDRWRRAVVRQAELQQALLLARSTRPASPGALSPPPGLVAARPHANGDAGPALASGPWPPGAGVGADVDADVDVDVEADAGDDRAPCLDL